jgi:DNA-binding NarL/FixJ family response regulator
VSVRVALADESFLVREALRWMLADMPEVEVVATCGDAGELRAAVDAARPDVVLAGVGLAADVGDRLPGIALIALGNGRDAAPALALFASGSDGRAYLLEQDLQHPGQLQAAIETVACGGSLIDTTVVERLMHRSPVAGLTADERATLGEMARGSSNAAIARTLGIPVRAVERHIHAIFEKLDVPATPDVNRRVSAVLRFLATDRSGRVDVAV